MRDLVIRCLTIESQIDEEGTIEIEISDSGRTWMSYEQIDKDDAKQIIEHLQKVFNLGADDDNV